MGRWSTGIYEAGQCRRIELSHLLKNGYLVKGKITGSRLAWTHKGEEVSNIGIYCVWSDENKFIELDYTSTDRHTGEKHDLRYRIEIVSVPSNLGKGEVLYFLCPSGFKCRVLYLAYGSHKWYSRKYYESIGKRIYYPCQSRSKRDYVYERRYHYEKQYNKIQNQLNKNFHKYHLGSKTKTFKKYEMTVKKLNHYEFECDKILAEFVNKFSF